MDWLDELIKENKEMFATDEPLDGHYGRFEERLRREKKRHQIRLAFRILSVAAMGLVLVASSIFIYERLVGGKPAVMYLRDVNPEMSRVEYYFTTQIEQTTAGIDSLAAFSDEATRSLMNREMAEMDSVHTALTRQLGQYPGDERIINAMIGYYRTKLEIMNSFLLTLEQIRQEQQFNNNNYETIQL